MQGGRQSGLMIGCIFFCCLLVDEPITGVGRYLEVAGYGMPLKIEVL